MRDPDSDLTNIFLLLRTVRDYQPGQIFARVLLSTKRKYRRLSGSHVSHLKLKIKVKPFHLNRFIRSQEEIFHEANQTLKGEFTFLNQRVSFGEKIDWQCPQVSRLWRFNLHYCAATVSLADAFVMTGDQGYLLGLKEQIRSWMVGNAYKSGDAWFPYTLSLRVSNWILAGSKVWDVLKEDEVFIQEFLGSLWEQLTFLKSNLEFDLRGNHLLENCKALTLGGLFFGKEESGAKFFRRGEDLLIRQLIEQILPDGGHFERSPMYHCIVLEDLLLLGEAYRAAGLEPPDELLHSLARMLDYLETLLLPDGKYPLFNDSAEKIAPAPTRLKQWAGSFLGTAFTGPKRNKFLPSTGFARLTTETGDLLLFDGGAPGPLCQPGHAHAGTLGFESCLGDGTRVFIDPGVFEYNSGLWRCYFRSTAAHNTLQIDGLNSTEVWGGFRAARKARIKQSGFRQNGKVTHVYAAHDGFCFLPGKPVHRRDIFCLPQGAFLVIDTITGAGPRLIESRLHLHPVWQPFLQSDTALILENGSRKLSLRFFKTGNLSIHRGEEDPVLGWYAPEFGIKEPTSCITWSKQCRLPYQSGFIFYHSNLELDFFISEKILELSVNGIPYVFTLEPGTIKMLELT